MTDLASDVVGDAGAVAAAGPTAATGPRSRPWYSRRWVLAGAEAVVSVAAALGFAYLCRHISVNPLNRIGQVSGLAKIQQYAAILGLPVLAVLVYTAYRGRLARHQVVQRLACAAVAGLSTGVVAGGVVVALRGTPWPLGGQEGDPSVLVDMATYMMHGKGLPGVYPPGFPAVMAAWSEIRYGGVGGAGYALHDLQIVFSALVGPMSYLAWRLVLRPFWAALIAVPAAVVFLDPIRPYSHVVMIMLVPLLAACLRELRRAGDLPLRSAALRGLAFGVTFGLLFLWYSGWYLWSAPGIGVLALFVFPWRRGRRAVRQAAVFVGVTLLSAGLVGAPLLYQLVELGADSPDRYAYITTYVDPTYVLGWMSDRDGSLTFQTWPVSGELAGQTGFALLLLAGVGLGIGLGLKHIAVRTAAAALVSAWLLRFWFASHMAHDQAIQLYPRTTWIIMYSLMILAVLGLMSLVHRTTRFGDRTLASLPATGGATRLVPRRAMRQLAAGMVCALALFATMGASWSVNRYMPADQSTDTMGLDAWRAHTIKKPDGSCPKFSPVAKCADIITKDWAPKPDTGQLWCAGIQPEEWKAVCGRTAPWLDDAKK
ncbi:hypothetical protein [Kitasatospora sp. NBC_00315]|uniref:hypothetical protein n=1 Tax=Kitasatospora sp. NBC_00315 TaxID=2975963 RepID=UPI00324BF74A